MRVGSDDVCHEKCKWIEASPVLVVLLCSDRGVERKSGSKLLNSSGGSDRVLLTDPIRFGCLPALFPASSLRHSTAFSTIPTILINHKAYHTVIATCIINHKHQNNNMIGQNGSNIPKTPYFPLSVFR